MSSKPMFQEEKCLQYLDKLAEIDSLSMFSKPVDPKEVPGYDAMISSPMDLSTIRSKIKANQYKSDTAVEEDVVLMITNALEFNRKDSEYYALAKKLRRSYHQLAVTCGLEVDEDTSYVPTKRFRDEESSIAKAERKGVEDIKEVMKQIREPIPVDVLRKQLEEYKKKMATQEAADSAEDEDEDEEDDDDEEKDDEDDEDEDEDEEDEEEDEESESESDDDSDGESD